MKSGPWFRERCRFSRSVAMAIGAIPPMGHWFSDGVARGILAFEDESHAGPRAVGPQRPLDRSQRAVEQEVLDPVVVVEELEVPHGGESAARVRVQRRSTVRREGQAVRLAE